MSDAPTPELEKQLSDLTNWHGTVPGLWRRALNSSSKSRRPVPGWLLGALAAAALLFVAVMVSLPSLQRTRVARNVTSPTPAITAQELMPEPIMGPAGGSGKGSARGGPPTQSPSNQAGAGIERQVIRKATIELKAQDVRAVFLKASQLLSEARGEYVQDSSLTGEGAHTEANLTLRIAAERLPEVLNELRQLGEVRSEKIGGEDVTSQVVDLEARLRNEQRVEAELLNLLESRKNSPLNEILELRSSISSVRQTIERLTAQRDRVSRLVSLATVLVIIRPADAPAPPPPQTGLWSHFVDAFQRAWDNGTLFLVNTLAGLVSVLIGGLVWWLLLVVAILVVRAYRRRPRTPA